MTYHDETKNSPLGWKVRRIIKRTEDSVTLDNNVSYMSACFNDAKIGELWAVLHEPCGPFVFGMVEKAIRLEPATPLQALDGEWLV